MNKRCVRKGHKVKYHTFRIYRKAETGDYKTVCRLMRVEREYCKRCKEEISRNEKEIGSFTSMSWPSSMYERFKEQGWVEENYY